MLYPPVACDPPDLTGEPGICEAWFRRKRSLARGRQHDRALAQEGAACDSAIDPLRCRGEPVALRVASWPVDSYRTPTDEALGSKR